MKGEGQRGKEGRKKGTEGREGGGAGRGACLAGSEGQLPASREEDWQKVLVHKRENFGSGNCASSNNRKKRTIK